MFDIIALRWLSVRPKWFTFFPCLIVLLICARAYRWATLFNQARGIMPSLTVSDQRVEIGD